MMSPAVITSRVASKDLEKIKAQHADILTGIANQTIKIQQYNQQKSVEQQNQQVMRNELEKEKMAANTNDMKTALDFQTKQSELDIKRAALTAV